MRIEALLFDLDGVLIFSKEVWYHLLNATARAFNARAISRALFEETWGQGVKADVERFFPHSTVPKIEEYYHIHFLDYFDLMKVEPAAEKVFAALKNAGLPVVVVSNTPAPTVREVLARVGLEPDDVVGGTDVPNPKPAPDMVLLALERLEIGPDAALLVGDTAFDRDAARAARVRFAGYGIEGDISLAGLGDLLPHLGIDD